MIALISPAKTMRSSASEISRSGHIATEPRFAEQANYIVSLMLRYSAVELSEIFKISAPIARELKLRFESIFENSGSPIAAIDSYDGVVYKHFKSNELLSSDKQNHLQNHLLISSLLYGLLRPFDQIEPYRMEGFVRLAGSDQRVDRYWRDIQTSTLIEDVNSAGGELLYLASKEEQRAFNWSLVVKSVRVIDFQFLQQKGDKLRQVVIYTKMARGEMIRYIIENKITEAEEVKTFRWGGYKYCKALSSQDIWVWLME